MEVIDERVRPQQHVRPVDLAAATVGEPLGEGFVGEARCWALLRDTAETLGDRQVRGRGWSAPPRG